jgi:hypothetical protein
MEFPGFILGTGLNSNVNQYIFMCLTNVNYLILQMSENPIGFPCPTRSIKMLRKMPGDINGWLYQKKSVY